ncbi:hypothetical protein CsatB_027830 [Cannabis sativa]|uniref:DUF674 domain-containing protein n=1 Tax=Cannabis sativa TaxID=3483 RepID=A0A7J6F9H5_CANSA|nr:uncharacterized protein LOC115723148 [Cannabis sativa]KAF4367326.1 hypothetical protein F8388_025744 [Cannabis sativa]
MASSTSSPNIITLKLLINTKEKRVLFAEAGKDFTDFLFSLLSMPIGTIIRLLSTNGMVGTLGKLYQSLENLSETYIQSNVNKDTLLKPKSSSSSFVLLPLLLLTNTNTTTTNSSSSSATPTNNVKQIFSCGTGYQCNSSPFNTYSSCRKYVSDDSKAICPNCKSFINKMLTYVPPPLPPNNNNNVGLSSSSSSSLSSGVNNDHHQVGIVKGVVTYMIMDDLEVKPMSTISSIALLNTFNVKEVGALEEKTVSLGINEGLRLLKASLETKTVLTHVFLGK